MYINPVTLSNQRDYAPGFISLTDEQFETYIKYNGLVKIVSTDPVEIEPDVEKWEAWKAEEAANPKPVETPTTEERLSALESAMLALIGGAFNV